MITIDVSKANSWTFNAKFDKRIMKNAMRVIGRKVAKDGKIYAVKGGDFPNKKTGALRKAINAKVSKSGFMVKVVQKMPQGVDKFYPAYLIYGTKRGMPKHSSWIAQSYDINEGFAQENINKVLQGIEL